jgi:hypothetical protein
MVNHFPPRYGPGGITFTSDAGAQNVAAPANATTVLATGPGILSRVMVNTAGTASGNVQFFDDPVSAQGDIVATIPGNAAVGPQPPIQMTFQKGLVCVNPANGPVMMVGITLANT